MKEVEAYSDASPGSTEPAVRPIAFYLPQFHPIPENDEWWGKGFTEWTNVAKAKALFKGHYQPRLPGELGFYDLRVPEAREAQANLAREYGIEAFCYWHYWFAGKRLLERPFQEVLESGKPDFPFCLAWANETWSGIWHGSPGRILQEQTYPGEEDHRKHFAYLLKAFKDARYVRVKGKPLFVIYRPRKVPNVRQVLELWRNLAADAGLAGLYLVAVAVGDDTSSSYRADGFDGVTASGLTRAIRSPHLLVWGRLLKRRPRLRSLFNRLFPMPQHVYRYESVWRELAVDRRFDVSYHPSVMANWDNTPRSGTRGWVLHDSAPDLFRRHLQHAIDLVETRSGEEKIIFLKSWNEWAEGNYLEPDRRYGRQYLEVIRDTLAAGDHVPVEAPTGP
ncbi:MAG: glycosyltransferase WbsX family protein [Chthoniobacterales bacterium]